MSMPPASSRSSLPCLGVSRLVLKPVALSRNSLLHFETPRTVSGPLTSSRGPQPHVVTSSFISTPVALVQHPSSYSSFPISVSNKNVENHLTSIKKKAEGIRSQGETTHQLILELYARLGFTTPATTAPVVTQPAPPASPTSSATDAPTRSKTFSYTCRTCAENDHWTKDCPNPHRFDVRYLSKVEIQKVLDDRLKAESLALSGPPKDEDNIIPVQAAPPPPEPKTPLTLPTSSSEGDLCCIPDPLGAAPLKTLVSSRRLPKRGANVRATSPYLTFLPVLAPRVPTLRLVERPYIPPDPQVYWNTLGPMGSFRFCSRLAIRWPISTMRPSSLC